MTGYVPGEQPRSEKVIKLNTNENPYHCSPKVKAAIGRVVQQGLQKYPDPLATAFRIQAGEVLGFDPEWILCGNGSDEMLTMITRAFVDSGDMRAVRQSELHSLQNAGRDSGGDLRHRQLPARLVARRRLRAAGRSAEAGVSDESE